MRLVYILSLIYLIGSFLMYKKIDKKISIISSITYSICLLFCYNVLIVSIYSLFKIDGSLMVLASFNIVIGTLLNLISFKNKKVQLYYFNKKEFIGILTIILVVFFIGVFRFRGFNSISYETGDPAVHYRGAIHFSRELEILTTNNSKDVIYNSFERVMPISYVNCGIMMTIFSNVKSYQIFILFDVFCLSLSSLLFFITILNMVDKKKYFYSMILTLLYLLGFPLNNLIFGFSYLGLGVMIINLLFFTVFKLNKMNNKILFNVIILFTMCFSVFFSYYLFVPCVYLALGLYYIYLWKKKKITIGNLLLYGVVTLIIPFVIGIINFVLPGFFDSNSVNIFNAIGMDGYIYENKTSRYFFVIISFLFLINFYIKHKKINYYWLNFGSISLYISLFYFLYKIEFVSLYYFYKLFYLYWFFAIIFIGNLLLKRREYLYTIFTFIIIGMIFVYFYPYNLFSNFLVKSNIFSWNAKTFIDKNIIYTKNELKILNESINYEDTCDVDGEFLISGHRFKNNWYYSYSGNVPLYGYQYGRVGQIGDLNITFDYWKSLDEYKCLIYFYEEQKPDEDIRDFKILYSNSEGAILKKQDK